MTPTLDQLSRLNRYPNHSMSRNVLPRMAVTVLIIFAIASAAGEKQLFGGELSDAITVDLVEVMDNTEKYVDQNIKITGRVENVCPMKGCWVEVQKPESDVSIRVKVEDDVVVFPAEAKGKSIVAEGILRRFELSEKQSRAWLKHAAAERGEEFDDSATIEPMILYQIEGLAAEIDDLTPTFSEKAASINSDG